jgi:uncharacterized protein (DUF488 family)
MMAGMSLELFTIGHGTLPAERFEDLLRGSAVERLVDVRTAPGSRRVPHFARAAMQVWLPEAGVAYRWEQRLGGWRRTVPESPHAGLRNAAFRGYAHHMQSAEFVEAMAELLSGAAEARTAVMCAESLWWRCHRGLLADWAVLLGGATVIHLLHDGKLSVHGPSRGAMVHNGRLLYPASTPTPPNADRRPG